MIITCPDCQTRYKTSSQAIGPNGRTVRCANCESTWFVPAAHDELTLDQLSLADNEDAETHSSVRETTATGALKRDLSKQSQIRESFAKPGVAAATAAATAAKAETAWTGRAPEPEPSLRDAHSQLRDKADRKRSRRRLSNVMMIWLVPLILIGLAALAAYHFRQKIVDQFPKSATLYKAVGVQVSAPGLILTPPSTHYAKIDGKRVLVVEGTVKNISQESKAVPMIALSLHNASGEALASWNVELEQARLSAGGSGDYRSQYPNPPLDGEELRSGFADETSGMVTPIELTPIP